GVYTISFLSVMALFGIGNILLKVKRNKLPRPEKATWISVLIAIVAVIFAISGNILMVPKDPDIPSNLSVFLEYFIPSIIFIVIMLNRTILLKFLLTLIHSVFDPIRRFVLNTDRRILSVIDDINKQEFVFFTKGDNIATLNKVMLYITKNEHTKKLKIVLAKNKDTQIPENLPQEIEFLDKEYPEIDIELVIVEGKFTPELIKKLSKKWNIPINFMFIGSPSDKFPYKIEELGGVRLII
ncbi:MAG TPA: APC family permease, partial [Flavobacteriia bacterium]|nr:APC family permease [Flavobacteriia bacterium]